MEFGPSLLGIEANGWRYGIARSEGKPTLGAKPGLYLVDGDSVGVIAGAWPLGQGSGGSTEPFEHWIVAGLTPPRTRRVEIETPDGVQIARFRSGMWIAAIPIEDRRVRFSVRFLDADGTMVAEEEDEEVEIPSRRLGSRSA
jgi:hypothetical protein